MEPFNTAENYTVGNHPYGVVVGDFNNDSKQDIVVASHGEV
ncbi:MAG: hypothetical protein MRQ07_02080 [Candidatus Midichloria sp.]|nr:hypothetical protein [Candidatus Midichloria sp.]